MNKEVGFKQMLTRAAEHPHLILKSVSRVSLKAVLEHSPVLTQGNPILISIVISKGKWC